MKLGVWRGDRQEREILSVDKGLSVLEGCGGREVAGVGLIQELGIPVRKGPGDPNGVRTVIGKEPDVGTSSP